VCADPSNETVNPAESAHLRINLRSEATTHRFQQVHHVGFRTPLPNLEKLGQERAASCREIIKSFGQELVDGGPLIFPVLVEGAAHERIEGGVLV
jgi:hypothetical protein